MESYKYKNIFGKFSFAIVLKEVLMERQKKNSKYSLRAFARDIELSPSTVSRIFNDKYDLSIRLVEDVLLRIGVSSDKIQRIVFFESCFHFLKSIQSNQHIDCSEKLDLTNCSYKKILNVDKDLFKETTCLIYLINDVFF